VRIAIADDHPIVRDGLKRLLQLENDFEIIGEAGDGRQVLDLVGQTDPDILLLDLRMPNLDGLSTLQALQHANRRTRVIVLTASEDKSEFMVAMKLGCSGIVLKHTEPDLIVKSIRKVHSGEIWLDSHTTAAVMQQFSTALDPARASGVGGRDRNPLSTREREIVRLVAQGYKNKEMAEKMFISEQTG
jgi:DNA-binding NarL/FixJ family response regulator